MTAITTDAREGSTAWIVYRRDALLRAEAALLEAGRAAELVPDDADCDRLARRAFRSASRARQARMRGPV